MGTMITSVSSWFVVLSAVSLQSSLHVNAVQFSGSIAKDLDPFFTEQQVGWHSISVSPEFSRLGADSAASIPLMDPSGAVRYSLFLFGDTAGLFGGNELICSSSGKYVYQFNHSSAKPSHDDDASQQHRHCTYSRAIAYRVRWTSLITSLV